jgi:hypothetical protein
MSSGDIKPLQLSPLCRHALSIEHYMATYCSIHIAEPAHKFIESFSKEFLEHTCPEAIDLPAAFIVNEVNDEFFIGIHLSHAITQELSSHDDLKALLDHREGLNAFLILAEEISHFHHWCNMTEVKKPLSRFDLELQAEMEKVIVGSLALIDTFGRSHIRELIQILFNESTIHGQLTNYILASRLAERFWKENLKTLGPELIFDARLRKLLQHISQLTGEDKRRLVSLNLSAA